MSPKRNDFTKRRREVKIKPVLKPGLSSANCRHSTNVDYSPIHFVLFHPKNDFTKRRRTVKIKPVVITCCISKGGRNNALWERKGRRLKTMPETEKETA